MKSRFDALTSSDHRHGRAVFRASAAVSIVVSLLALSALHHDRALEVTRTDLFAMEMGLAQPVRVTDIESPSSQAQVAVQAGPAKSKSSAEDEFSFGPHYTGEAGGY